MDNGVVAGILCKFKKSLDERDSLHLTRKIQLDGTNAERSFGKPRKRKHCRKN
jgi:hypothetical protein